jgi:carbon-monoxide dehydrogenase medium subunit
MKPPIFDYQRADSLQHACELLSEFGDDAKILAGGQTLIPMMNFRLARPAVLVDISNVPERCGVADEVEGVRIKATTIQRYVERAASVRKRLPVLHRAIEHIAHFQIRNKGTLGGSISNADPASELPAMAMLLDAEFEIMSKDETRIVPADEFFITYMTTAMNADEVMSSVLFKTPPAGSGWGFQEVARRSGDFALAGSSAVVTLDSAGVCTRARIALFGVAATPVRATDAEDMLVGQRYSAALLKSAAATVQDAIDPEGDVHVTAAYRRSVVQELTGRVLEEAFKGARNTNNASAQAVA